MRFAHPLEFLPYQYEGFEPMEREVLRRLDISMRLIDRGTARADAAPAEAAQAGAATTTAGSGLTAGTSR
jgi:hypothetical protein